MVGTCAYSITNLYFSFFFSSFYFFLHLLAPTPRPCPSLFHYSLLSQIWNHSGNPFCQSTQWNKCEKMSESKTRARARSLSHYKVKTHRQIESSRERWGARGPMYAQAGQTKKKRKNCTIFGADNGMKIINDNS